MRRRFAAGLRRAALRRGADDPNFEAVEHEFFNWFAKRAG